MASKNRFNIVLGATINKEALQKELNKISETKVKINIDVAHLRSQIQSIFNNIKINVGGSSENGTGVQRKYKGELDPESRVIHSRSTKTYFDEENKEIREMITGYDELGHKITELNRIYTKNNETIHQRLSSTEEEGNLANKNAVSYEQLGKKIEELGANANASAERVQGLNRQLNAINQGTDEFEKQKQYKELAEDIKQATNETRQFESEQKRLEAQTQKNQQTFEALTNRLKNLKDNGQITKKQFEDLNKRLQESKKITDPNQLQANLEQTGQQMSDVSKHAMSIGGMLKTAYEKFANFTPKIATSYRNVC